MDVRGEAYGDVLGVRLRGRGWGLNVRGSAESGVLAMTGGAMASDLGETSAVKGESIFFDEFRRKGRNLDNLLPGEGLVRGGDGEVSGDGSAVSAMICCCSEDSNSAAAVDGMAGGGSEEFS
jgi:hypothetical protein